jgi:class 3 adenylate cyclase
MSKIALAQGAHIDKFIGDAMLVFFGDPETKGFEEDARACVRMAVAMQRQMAELHASGFEQPFQMRIGINTGYCNVGNFGSEDRMDYTIIGAEVNLAARIQAAAASSRRPGMKKPDAPAAAYALALSRASPSDCAASRPWSRPAGNRAGNSSKF